MMSDGGGRARVARTGSVLRSGKLRFFTQSNYVKGHSAHRRS